MSSRSNTTLAVLTASIVALFAPAIANASVTSKPPCKKHAGELYSDNSGWIRVWHDRDSILACSQATARWNAKKQQWKFTFVTKRLGPWSRGSKVSYDWASDTVVWLRPQKSNAGTVQRLWASTVSGSPVLRRVPAHPGVGGVAADGAFSALAYGPGVLAWISGDAAFMVKLGGGQSTFSSGFTTPPTVAGPIVALGSWAGAADALASSLHIASESGEADECGGGGTVTVSINPVGTKLEARSDYSYDGKCYGL